MTIYSDPVIEGERSGASDSVMSDVAGGMRRFFGILRRWRLLIVGCVVVALLVGIFASAGAPSGYDATAVVLIDQPALGGVPTAGLASVQEISSLMPTIAALAVSHSVLAAVRRQVGLSEPVSALRSAVQVTTVTSTITLDIAVHMPSAHDTTAVANDLVAQLNGALGVLSQGVATGATRFAAITLQRPVATKVASHASRTILLALVIGLLFSVAAAVVLDRS